MISLKILPELAERISVALRAAGKREVGGILMGEHTGPNEFVLRDLTVQRRGLFGSFVRRLEEALGRLEAFFDAKNRDYKRFNYLGEWHSHPSFVPEPSSRDDASMRELILDRDVGANFVVLLIVKLNGSGALVGSGHVYLPDGSKTKIPIDFK